VADGCADRARACDEPPFGTASRARRWVLLEQPGSWGADALRSSDLPDDVAGRLRVLTSSLPARVLLLRRPGGRRSVDGSRSLYVAWTSPDRRWLEHLRLDDVRDLLDLDLTPLARGSTVGGRRVEEPRYLVCTNGRHDRCCATYGRPVAQELERLVGDRVWECSHVGGDRFAGNVVCLPSGQFYGRLDASTARLVVEATEQGRLALAHWRGCSAQPFPVQAAEALVRLAEGLEHLDAVRVTGLGAEVDGIRPVTMELAGRGEMTAHVRIGRREAPEGLTCGGGPAHAPTYELVDLDPSKT
jgi:hypothetical protein